MKISIMVKKCFSIEKEHIQVRLNYCPFWFVNISHCDQKVKRYKRSALQYQPWLPNLQATWMLRQTGPRYSMLVHLRRLSGWTSGWKNNRVALYYTGSRCGTIKTPLYSKHQPYAQAMMSKRYSSEIMNKIFLINYLKLHYSDKTLTVGNCY